MPVLISKVHTHTPVFVKEVVIVAATAVISSNLYSLDLVGHHHGVLFADLGSSLGLVIIGTVVLVGVPVDATEQVTTATVKPWKHRGQGSNNRTGRVNDYTQEVVLFPSVTSKTIITDRNNMCCIRCPFISPLLTCKAHPFAAHEAPVLLGFGGVTLAFFTAGRSYRSRARSSRLAYNYMKKDNRENNTY